MVENEIDEFINRIQSFLASKTITEQPKREIPEDLLQELSTLMEELSTAEEELRAQNEELEASRISSEQERQRYQDLFDLAPATYLVTDPSGIILEANQTAALLFGRQPPFLVGSPLPMLIDLKDRRWFRKMIKELDGTRDFEAHLQGQREGHSISIIGRVSPVYESVTDKANLLWMVSDVTKMRRMQDEVESSEQRFRTIFANALTGIALIDKNQRILEANRSLQTMVGYYPQELRKNTFFSLAHPEDTQRMEHLLNILFEQRINDFSMEARLLQKSGQEIWVQLNISRMNASQGESGYAIVLVEDVTLKRQFEKERTEMQHRLLDGIEQERVTLARDLHDGPIQDLYGALFGLVALQDGSASGHEAAVKAAQASHQIQQVINSLRATCGELRPPSLKFFGLDKAVRSHVDLMQEKYPNLVFDLTVRRERDRLPEDIVTAVFRAFQQGLSNIVRHAGASEVKIDLWIGQETLRLKLEDNGRGFGPEFNLVELVREGHYGLAGIAERMQSVGGKMEVDTKPSGGTRLMVEAPLPRVQ